jgi:hypothetical protein
MVSLALRLHRQVYYYIGKDMNLAYYDSYQRVFESCDHAVLL